MRSKTSTLGAKKNKNAFSIVVAMGLVLVMAMLVLYILEYMVPYSKNVKGIENSSNAFYQAENSIEDGLYFFKTRTGSTKYDDKSKDFSSTLAIDYKYRTYSTGSLIPYNSEGNSEFDNTYNKISPGNPIQLDIGDDLDVDWASSNTKFYFKVPNLDFNSSTEETLSGNSDTAIINWQISTEDDTINATGSWIMADEICNSKEACSGIDMSNRQGIDLDGNEGSNEKFKNFYDNNCGASKKCSLKMSVINKLELNSNNTSIPYLEYKITTDKKIPLRFSRIKSEGKSYGFHKYLEVRVPQQTTNEAFDFTVFQ